MVQDRPACYGTVNSHRSSKVPSPSRPPNTSSRPRTGSVDQLRAPSWRRPHLTALLVGRRRPFVVPHEPQVADGTPLGVLAAEHNAAALPSGGGIQVSSRRRWRSSLDPAVGPRAWADGQYPQVSQGSSTCRLAGIQDESPVIGPPAAVQASLDRRVADRRFVGPGRGREVICARIGKPCPLARETVADPETSVGSQRRTAAVARNGRRAASWQLGPAVIRRVVGPQVVVEGRAGLAGEDHQAHPGHPCRVVPEAGRRPARQLLPRAVGVVVRPQVGDGTRIATTAEQVRELAVSIRSPGVVFPRRRSGPGRGRFDETPAGQSDGGLHGRFSGGWCGR